MEENKIRYGIKNVYYAIATFNEDGDVLYGKPVHIPGAVSLSLDAEGESEPWYADNMVYTVLNGSAGYSGALEIAIIPESFAQDILHEELDENGLMAENTSAEIEHFALMFQFEGDKKAIRHVFYNCTCSRPSIESATTEDAKEPQTDTLDLTAMPLANGYVKGKTCSKTLDSIYNAFFDEVVLPGGAMEPHTVYFYNGDTLLQTVTDVPFGGTATYTGSTPTKTGYNFIGWDPEPVNITADTYCYAQFEIKTFTVSFYNGSTLLQTVTDVPYGGSATYTGNTPVSPDNPDLRFLGWDPEPTNITKDTKCYAQFEAQTYTVYFYNGDTLLQTVTGVVYGGSATYTGSTPEKEGYTFTGWDPEPVNITEDTKCYAQFEALAAFAVYSADDSSLIFYADDSAPQVGEKYNGKTVTAVYTDLTNTRASGSSIPWYGERSLIASVKFDKSFSVVKPFSTAYWFNQFSNCKSMDFSNFDTSEVTNMEGMFQVCSALTEFDLSPLDTGNVTNMSYLFMMCTGLTNIDLSPLDTSSVTNMEGLFIGCTGLTELDLKPLDTGKATNMASMFSSCTGLTELDLTPLDTSKVTNMSNMFYGNSGLSAIDLKPLNTSNVTDMSYLFGGCSGLTTLDLSPLETDNAVNMQYMFSSCSRLTELDLTPMKTVNVTNMSHMFYNCTRLVTIYSDDAKFTIEKVSSGDNMFTNDRALVGGAGTAFDGNKNDSSMAHVDTAENPGYFTAK